MSHCTGGSTVECLNEAVVMSYFCELFTVEHADPGTSAASSVTWLCLGFLACQLCDSTSTPFVLGRVVTLPGQVFPSASTKMLITARCMCENRSCRTFGWQW